MKKVTILVFIQSVFVLMAAIIVTTNGLDSVAQKKNSTQDTVDFTQHIVKREREECTSCIPFGNYVIEEKSYDSNTFLKKGDK